MKLTLKELRATSVALADTLSYPDVSDPGIRRAMKRAKTKVEAEIDQALAGRK